MPMRPRKTRIDFERSSLGDAEWRRLGHTSDFFGHVNVGWKAFSFEHDFVMCVARYRDGKMCSFFDLVSGDLEDMGEGVVNGHCMSRAFFSLRGCNWSVSGGCLSRRRTRDTSDADS